MTIHKTIQRRVHLRESGHKRLDRVMRACAALYNASLQHWRDAYKATRDNPKPDSVTTFGQFRLLTQIRKDDPEGWGALDRTVGRGVIRRRDMATGG